ncbi:Type 1 glutamine amidotransferase-like domain-containing protein [Lacimicrobium sp. SS2-24]|uniref:cyanophycinase n=1 Tax=Lacimicrobium sp. SS2-24 TaxID=2005569 RepID=UPI000B4B849F|nr:Type 1 glutamine amidotransferase-like domain-containing protein [Lacimicrobium sp. SS2-24]
MNSYKTLISCALCAVFSVSVSAAKPDHAGGGGGGGGGGDGGGSGSYEYSLACGSTGNSVTTSQATLLIGGAEAGASGEVNATQWLVNHAPGGDYLVLRTGGTGSQAAWMCDTFGNDLGSAAELSIDDRSAADNPDVAALINDAEIIFIAGGDQNQYEDNWKGTLVETALNQHISSDKAPVAGTSAGLAILGQSYYAPANLGVLSREILDDPYHVNTNDINHGDFLLHPQLAGVITDTHLDRVSGKGRKTETRHGRTFGFLARSVADTGSLNARAIGVDEGTLVALDNSGVATVYGEGSAYFMQPNNYPEQIQSGQSLVWDNGGQAVSVYRIQGSVSGNGSFDVQNWNGSGGNWSDWFTTSGYDGFNCPSGC